MKKIKTIKQFELDEISLKILNSALSYCGLNYDLIDLATFPLLREKNLDILNNELNFDKRLDPNEEKLESNSKRDLLSPIFIILNSKKFSQDALSILEKSNSKSKESLILIRMYKDYLKMLDEVFDKWNSLRLLEKLEG